MKNSITRVSRGLKHGNKTCKTKRSILKSSFPPPFGMELSQPSKIISSLAWGILWKIKVKMEGDLNLPVIIFLQMINDGKSKLCSHLITCISKHDWSVINTVISFAIVIWPETAHKQQQRTWQLSALFKIIFLTFCIVQITRSAKLFCFRSGYFVFILFPLFHFD